MLDILGNEVKVGDTVVSYNWLYKSELVVVSSLLKEKDLTTD